jgi:hypothetical protein
LPQVIVGVDSAESPEESGEKPASVDLAETLQRRNGPVTRRYREGAVTVAVARA